MLCPDALFPRQQDGAQLPSPVAAEPPLRQGLLSALLSLLLLGPDGEVGGIVCILWEAQMSLDVFL